MTKKTKHVKKHFHWNCLQCFFTSRILESRKDNCFKKSFILPKEGTYDEFWNFKISLKALFVIYADLKCVLVPSTDNSYNDPITEKCLDHIVCNDGYILICVDKQYCEPFKSNFEDAIEKLWNDIINESEYCRRIIEREFYLWLKKIIKILKIY